MTPLLNWGDLKTICSLWYALQRTLAGWSMKWWLLRLSAVSVVCFVACLLATMCIFEGFTVEDCVRVDYSPCELVMSTFPVLVEEIAGTYYTAAGFIGCFPGQERLLFSYFWHTYISAWTISLTACGCVSMQDLLADSNPMVVANAVAALADIRETSTQDLLVLTNQSLFKLLRALNECTEWGQVRWSAS